MIGILLIVPSIALLVFEIFPLIDLKAGPSTATVMWQDWKNLIMSVLNSWIALSKEFGRIWLVWILFPCIIF